MNNLILHIHPQKVHARTLPLTHTWGLGGMSLVLVILLAISGVLLMFEYEPFPGKAYDSIVSLQESVPFGMFIRNIHHWSGNLLVIVAFLHLLRTYFTGGFHEPRRFNWIIGLFLFLLVLISNFTGYLLPWDQFAYWAVTICTNMLAYLPGIGSGIQKVILGGTEVGADTLSLFFGIHVIVMPILLFILMPYHFWLVRKAGGVVMIKGSSDSPEDGKTFVPTLPNLTTKELSTGLVLIALIMVYAIFFNAPLDIKANPGLSPNPTKAPWFLIGIQELLMHFHPLIAAWIIPFLTACLLIILPYLNYDSDELTGRWFLSAKGRWTGIIAAVAAMIITPLAVISDSLLPDSFKLIPMFPGIIRNGLIPLIIIAGIIAGFYLFFRKYLEANKDEAVQAVFIFFIVSYVILTIICFWFRGEGMELGI